MAFLITSKQQQFSKTFLQSLSTDPQQIERSAQLIKQIQRVADDILQKAKMGEKKHTVNVTNHMKEYKHYTKNLTNAQSEEKAKEELLLQLRGMFTDCSIEIHETKGYSGDLLEAILVIDWS